MSFLTFETAKKLGYPEKVARIIEKFDVPPDDIQLTWDTLGKLLLIPNYSVDISTSQVVFGGNTLKTDRTPADIYRNSIWDTLSHSGILLQEFVKSFLAVELDEPLVDINPDSLFVLQMLKVRAENIDGEVSILREAPYPDWTIYSIWS